MRVEVRKAYYRQHARHEAHRPLPDTRLVPHYLDAGQGALRVTPLATEAHVAYEAPRGHAASSLRFTEAVDFTGAAELHVWVSTSDGDDLDLFVVLNEFDERGSEVCFSGYDGYRKDAVAKGRLHVSTAATAPMARATRFPS